MINTILGNIASVVEKEFLFASFLPTLLFIGALAATGGSVLGMHAALSVIENMSATRLAWTSSAAVIVLVVIAYVLSALRVWMTHFWSGDGSWLYQALFGGLVMVGESWQRRRFRTWRRKADLRRDWTATLQTFEDRVRPLWSNRNPKPRWYAIAVLNWRIRRVHRWLSPEFATRRLEVIADTFSRYTGDTLQEQYETVKRRLLDWDEEDSFESQATHVRLDRSFGSLATVKATRLGNVIESYNYYAFKRFDIEAELVWPRLEHVVPDSFAARVKEAKITMDFFITLCTMTSLYTGLALLVGPWILYNRPLWVLVAAAAATLARFFYLMGVDAAIQYGDRLRSCFDLFRLELLKKLGFGRPVSLAAERALWQKFSQLITYGAQTDLPVAPE